MKMKTADVASVCVSLVFTLRTSTEATAPSPLIRSTTVSHVNDIFGFAKARSCSRALARS
ncbi:hypothetical protein D3C83_303800 [compost metagenome]